MTIETMGEFGAFKPVSVSKQFVKLSICCIKMKVEDIKVQPNKSGSK
jgi:hypothetical protein